MELFEYLAIAFTLVFSFAATRVISGLPHAVRKERRYWVHLAIVGIQLSVTILAFWNYWTFSTVEWTFPSFVMALLSPAALYFTACTIMPEEPQAVESWKAYYFSVRRRFFAGLGFWIVVVTVNSSLLLGVPLAHELRLIEAATFAVCAIGFYSANERVHGALIVLALLVFFSSIVRSSYLPGLGLM